MGGSAIRVDGRLLLAGPLEVKALQFWAGEEPRSALRMLDPRTGEPKWDRSRALRSIAGALR